MSNRLASLGALLFTVINLNGLPASAETLPRTDAARILNETFTSVAKEDFASLDRLETQLRSTSAIYSDGRWALRDFYSAFPQYMAWQQNSLQTIEQQELFLQRWLKANPSSIAAPVLLGRAYTVHAILLRGSGLAKSLTPSQVAGYRQYLRLAKAAYVQNKNELSNPAWYASRLTTATSDSMSPEEFATLLKASLALSPEYNEPLQAAVHYSSPRWGGSVKMLDYLASTAYAIAGPEAYTVMYSEALKDDVCQCDFKRDQLPLNWKIYEQGMKLRLQKYSSAYMVNMYASIACNNGHPETGNSLVPRLMAQGKSPEVWALYGKDPGCARWIAELPAPTAKQ